jgi:plasmid stability protein
MPSLQIRDLPEPLHQQLQQRARQQNRSLSQQALTELEAAVGGDARDRRRAALERIAARVRLQGPIACPESPEAMVRSDRQR